MPKSSAKPHSLADMKISDYIARQIEIVSGTGKTQKDIANELGYDRPNIISMFKTGDAKVPLDKIPALARALNVDAAFLFRLALLQYWQTDAKAVADIFGTVLTKNEHRIIERIRQITKDSDPELTSDLDKKLRAAFK